MITLKEIIHKRTRNRKERETISFYDTPTDLVLKNSKNIQSKWNDTFGYLEEDRSDLMSFACQFQVNAELCIRIFKFVLVLVFANTMHVHVTDLLLGNRENKRVCRTKRIKSIYLMDYGLKYVCDLCFSHQYFCGFVFVFFIWQILMHFYRVLSVDYMCFSR